MTATGRRPQGDEALTDRPRRGPFELRRSPRARAAARRALSGIDLTRRVPGTPYTATFPTAEHLSLLRPGGMRYEPALVEVFRRHVPPGARVLDVGANVGLHTLNLARMVTPSGRVLAFEPDPQSSRYLVRNIVRNGLSNVVPSSIALSDVTGRASLHMDSLTTRTTSLLDSVTAPSDEEVRLTLEVATSRLDDLELGRIDFLKVDIEGAELRFLRGASTTLARDRPTLVIEATAGNSEEVASVLREIGYGSVTGVESGVRPGAEYGNILATP